MDIDKKIALSQIDEVIVKLEELKHRTNHWVIHEMIALIHAVIKRLAPPNSAYLCQMDLALNLTLSPSDIRNGISRNNEVESTLRGILQALRTDYETGHLQTFQEIIHANLFSDFLERADYLLQENYKDPAAVIAGSVLEEHLRKICSKYGVIPAKPKLDTMNSDLAKVGAYGKNDQKQVTAWAGLRNDAAHGNYASYGNNEVKLMVIGIRDFISRNPS